MYRIGQFAKLCHTSGKTLRFYDSLGILKPDYTDSSTGYRFYSKNKIMAFDKIRLLKKVGFTLKEIRNSFLCATDAEILSFLSLKEKKLLEAYENCRSIRLQYKEALRMFKNTPRIVIKNQLENGNISFSDGKNTLFMKFEGSGDENYISMMDELLNGDIIENINFIDLCGIAKTANTASFETLCIDSTNNSSTKDMSSSKVVKGAAILVKLPASKTLNEVSSVVNNVLSTLPENCMIIWGAAMDERLHDQFEVSVARFL